MDSRATGRAAQPWGAQVMATGIVSLGLRLAGFLWAARGLLVITAALWLVLAVTFCGLLLDGARREELAAPAVLTSVAGTGVLGNGIALTGHSAAAAVLLTVTAVLWLLLLPRVLRRLGRSLPGAAYLVTVATQSVAGLAAALAVPLSAPWLTWAAGVLLAAGLALYALVLSRFDLGQLHRGAGDHWVVAGSLSISALACARLAAATGRPEPLTWLTLAILAAALSWYAVLAVLEVVRPRPRYDPRRWSTVFPLGMTAVSAMTAATVCAVPWLRPVGEALLCPAVLAWLIVASGAVRRASGRPRSRRPGPVPVD